MSESLYDKYGGVETLSTIVTNFYQKILDSDSLEGYFDGVNLDRLIIHQTNFLSIVLGGPSRYEGLDMKTAHKTLGITVPAFNEVAELLADALEEAGVEDDDISTILSAVASLQNDVVST
jgi:hemoglobin